ncbi:MAG TPA: phage terminase large subunit family protein, partial [Verrucomicrobiae bacterium]|nr:phage terminase large subunit family protein [Verrucomicrobiae bacterium]
MNPFERVARAAWKPQDLRTAWEWCEEHIIVDNTSPLPGRWRSANSPWVKPLMEDYQDRRIREFWVKCSAQSSKTQTILNLLCYDVVEDPGPEMYVMANAEDAANFVDDRFLPTLKNCKAADDLLSKQKGLGFKFKTMPLYFVGAGSMAKLMGKPMKRLKLDEVRNYPPGALGTVLKRVRAFGATSQVFVISTPDKKDDVMDRGFISGDQKTFHFSCPVCGTLQQLRFAQLKWDTNEETKPGGKWNFDKVALTIRYECENNSCQHQIRDTPSERKMICREGRF